MLYLKKHRPFLNKSVKSRPILIIFDNGFQKKFEIANRTLQGIAYDIFRCDDSFMITIPVFFGVPFTRNRKILLILTELLKKLKGGCFLRHTVHSRCHPFS